MALMMRTFILLYTLNVAVTAQSCSADGECDDNEGEDLKPIVFENIELKKTDVDVELKSVTLEPKSFTLNDINTDTTINIPEQTDKSGIGGDKSVTDGKNNGEGMPRVAVPVEGNAKVKRKPEVLDKKKDRAKKVVSDEEEDRAKKKKGDGVVSRRGVSEGENEGETNADTTGELPDVDSETCPIDQSPERPPKPPVPTFSPKQVQFKETVEAFEENMEELKARKHHYPPGSEMREKIEKMEEFSEKLNGLFLELQENFDQPDFDRQAFKEKFSVIMDDPLLKEVASMKTPSSNETKKKTPSKKGSEKDGVNEKSSRKDNANRNEKGSTSKSNKDRVKDEKTSSTKSGKQEEKKNNKKEGDKPEKKGDKKDSSKDIGDKPKVDDKKRVKGDKKPGGSSKRDDASKDKQDKAKSNTVKGKQGDAKSDTSSKKQLDTKPDTLKDADGDVKSDTSKNKQGDTKSDTSTDKDTGEEKPKKKKKKKKKKKNASSPASPPPGRPTCSAQQAPPKLTAKQEQVKTAIETLKSSIEELQKARDSGLLDEEMLAELEEMETLYGNFNSIFKDLEENRNNPSFDKEAFKSKLAGLLGGQAGLDEESNSGNPEDKGDLERDKEDDVKAKRKSNKEVDADDNKKLDQPLDNLDDDDDDMEWGYDDAVEEIIFADDSDENIEIIAEYL